MPTGIHSVKPNPGSTHKRKRVGRGPGGGHGKTATRGSKGQWSRSGTSQKRGFEGGQMPLHRRIPKRGFTNAPFRKETTAINVRDLARFEGGSKVGPDELIAAGVIRKVAPYGLRVLGDGAIDRALHVSAHYFTPGAKEKILAAGGTAEVIQS
ncbi:MAG TPA: 50S ribosomal protein L15 [Terriglobia bacterium]|nr:50S ribosomal protein L15 [Terriglobia bacterium]